MPTYQEHYARLRGMGVGHAAADEDARKLAAPAAVAVAPAQPKAPPRDVLGEHGFDAQDARMAASLNAALDPGQQQARFARHAQLTAQLDALDTEIEAWLAPRRQRRQAIIDELAQL